MPAAGGQGPWGSSPAAPRGSAPSGDSTGCNGLDLVFTLEQTHVDEERVYSKEIQLYIKKEKKKKKRKTETVHVWIIEVQLTLLIHLGDTG